MRKAKLEHENGSKFLFSLNEGESRTRKNLFPGDSCEVVEEFFADHWRRGFELDPDFRRGKHFTEKPGHQFRLSKGISVSNSND